MDEADAARQAAQHYGRTVPLTQDEDVLDTWFSSALWPFSTLGWPERTPELARFYPTSVLVTGFDIIFFWVARMMMMGLKFMGEVPFREVYIHGLVRDERGQKMSKSKGNVIDPLELIERYGADALRFTILASTAQGRDIRFGEGRVQGYRNFGTKLWNAARFCELNGCELDPAFAPAALPPDRQSLGDQQARPGGKPHAGRARELPLQRCGERRSTISPGTSSATGISSSRSRCWRATTRTPRPRRGRPPPGRWRSSCTFCIR